MKENFTITDKETGKVYWISRAHAVVGAIMWKPSKNGQWHFLLEKRGPGCPDHIGKWCICCGYLNWGETRKEAIAREVFEETGFKVTNLDNIIELETIDDPKRDARENLCTRYAIVTTFSEMFDKLHDGSINPDTVSRGGEKDEVSELKVFSLDKIAEMDPDEFAFNHKDVIYEMIDRLERHNLFAIPAYADTI